jgi:predicted metalloprotease
MRWGDMRESQNVEDRTGMSSGGGGFPLGGGMRMGFGSLIVLVIVGLIFGINPLEMLGLMGGDGGVVQQAPPQSAPPGYGPQTTPSSKSAQPVPAPPATPEKTQSSKVLASTEDVWTAVFKAMGTRYEPPKLVLFKGSTRSGCGGASAAVGPFYCSQDRKLYLDTAFFDQLSRRFGAPGDFAQAYVIAHEVGHHVQNQLGTMQQFDAQMQRLDERGRNALSVRLELQADCYAGVWGFFAQKQNLLDPGDLEEGMRAAAAVGDDQIQKRTQGYVVPEGFTHGSAQQRQRWFKAGLDSGDPRSCNTFEARQI